MGGTTTLEHGGHGAAHDAPRVLGPFLFRLLSADDLAQPPARHSLARFAEADIGRGQAFGAQPRGPALRIDLRDPFASSSHVHLERGGGDWRVRDEGSRNGTMVDGERAPAGELLPLRDGPSSR